MSLRIAMGALSDVHQRLLVEAAFHALNDVKASAEVADLVGVDHESLAGEKGFACQVVAPLFDAARSEDAAAIGKAILSELKAVAKNIYPEERVHGQSFPIVRDELS